MKSLLLTIGLLTITLLSYSQNIYQIRADSVRIYNDCDTAEFILENHTQMVPGYLYNKGRGRTEFRRMRFIDLGLGIIAIGDQDTLNLGNSSLGDQFIRNQFSTAQLADYWIKGRGRVDSTFTLGKYKNNAAEDSVLTTDVNGNLKLKYAGETSVNIYNSDGSLTSNRTLTGNNYTLTLTGIGNYNIESSYQYQLAQSAGAPEYSSLQLLPGIASLQTGSNLIPEARIDMQKADSSITFQVAAPGYPISTPTMKYKNGFLFIDKYKNNETEDSVLTTDANGMLKLKYLGSDFYTADGTLTSDRYVNGDSHAIEFNTGTGFFASGQYQGKEYGIGTYERPTQNNGVRVTWGYNEMQVNETAIRFAVSDLYPGIYQFVIQSYGTETGRAQIDAAKIGYQTGAWYNTNPTVPLDVYKAPNNGYTAAMRIVDGNEGAGKVLTSDANGYATWQTPASTMSAASSGTMSITSVSSSTTLDDSQYTILANNTSAITVTLPAAASNTGRIYFIKKVSSNSSSVTVATSGADTIDGTSSYAISTYNKSIQVQSDGNAWYILTAL
ncbi:hypothetical protein [Chitinophaga japonensis]|uniref:Uncharacterized protein n=1 Tax=Chitinophaga japonensis TaxID=104662 RepID=A0A562SY30_CHIJA|nr:hypothetical protein [Chitinophaga japonensis]TWI86257.1 hypothetical protein LX66_3509 [Chitinophaga japonensis]